MVTVYGNSIVSAYTDGVSVSAIYTHGVKVWPDESIPEGYYYIKWWPKSISGSFIMGGQARWLEDYNGYYSGPFLTERISGVDYPYIDQSAFKGVGIVGVETNIPYIRGDAFELCTSLSYVSATNTKLVMTGAFASCYALSYIELPELTRLYSYTFDHCSNLKYAYFENVLSVGLDYTPFYSCWNLTEVYLPKCSAIDDYGMKSCGLSTIELPAIQRINGHAFEGCSNFQTLILPGSSIPSYIGEYAFSGTKMDTSSARVYVPISMLLDYRSAWPGWASIIYPIPHS